MFKVMWPPVYTGGYITLKHIFFDHTIVEVFFVVAKQILAWGYELYDFPTLCGF